MNLSNVESNPNKTNQDNQSEQFVFGLQFQS